MPSGGFQLMDFQRGREEPAFFEEPGCASLRIVTQIPFVSAFPVVCRCFQQFRDIIGYAFGLTFASVCNAFPGASFICLAASSRRAFLAPPPEIIFWRKFRGRGPPFSEAAS